MIFLDSKLKYLELPTVSLELHGNLDITVAGPLVGLCEIKMTGQISQKKKVKFCLM